MFLVIFDRDRTLSPVFIWCWTPICTRLTMYKTCWTSPSVCIPSFGSVQMLILRQLWRLNTSQWIIKDFPVIAYLYRCYYLLHINCSYRYHYASHHFHLADTYFYRTYTFICRIHGMACRQAQINSEWSLLLQSTYIAYHISITKLYWIMPHINRLYISNMIGFKPVFMVIFPLRIVWA